MAESYCVMLTTAGSQDEANRLAELLVASRLAACVQISAINSWYAWQGKVTHEPEYLLLVKTTADLYRLWKPPSSPTTATQSPRSSSFPSPGGWTATWDGSGRTRDHKP